MDKMAEIQLIAKTMQTGQAVAFQDGVKYALAELLAVYGEGIKETDIWAEYMEEGEN